MTTTTTPPLALPALPEPCIDIIGDSDEVYGPATYYSADQMNAHATAAILSDRAGRGDAAPVAQPPAIAEAKLEWEHLKQYGYAPGNYMNKCRTCGKVVEFVDKRASICRPCAEERHAATQPPAPVQQTEAVAEERETESRRAHQSAEGTNSELWRIGLLEWGVAGWRSEVQNRPLKNIHRERLDNFWRTVIRKAGGDPDTLVGPQELIATPPAPALPPVARVPLTRERILALWGDRSDGPPTHQIISFARAVEANTGEQSHG